MHREALHHCSATAATALYIDRERREQVFVDPSNACGYTDSGDMLQQLMSPSPILLKSECRRRQPLWYPLNGQTTTVKMIRYDSVTLQEQFSVPAEVVCERGALLPGDAAQAEGVCRSFDNCCSTMVLLVVLILVAAVER